MFRFDTQHSESAPPRIASIIPADEVSQLMRALADRNTSLAEVAKRIGQFPALVNRVLRMANSALTGTRNHITDPVHAVSMLGSRRLMTILAQLPADPAGGYRLPEPETPASAA
jgi:HD-like signal output (HDOD) protein